MDFLQSFSLRDLLIFSPESFFVLFELSNKAIWPFQLPLILLAIIAIIFLFKRAHFASRYIFIWLGLVWVFVGYWYFGVFYSQINPYAYILNYLFWVEAILLFLTAFLTKHETISHLKTSNKISKFKLGSGLLFYGLLIHPIVSLLIWKQPVKSVEFFSVSPDPTALATIGFILLLSVKRYLVLMIIPILWLIFSLITYLTF